MVMRQTAKRIANRFCLTAFFGQELRLIRPHQAYKNALQRLVRLALGPPWQQIDMGNWPSMASQIKNIN